MRILWLAHPSKPELNGTIAHVAREFATVAVGYSQAEYAPYKNYVERLQEESQQARALQPGDVAAPFVDGVRWGFQLHPLAGACLVKESGSEVARLSDADAAEYFGCPKKIADELRRYNEARMANAAANEQATRGNRW
jgi:hypothetical protein